MGRYAFAEELATPRQRRSLKSWHIVVLGSTFLLLCVLLLGLEETDEEPPLATQQDTPAPPHSTSAPRSRLGVRQLEKQLEEQRLATLQRRLAEDVVPRWMQEQVLEGAFHNPCPNADDTRLHSTLSVFDSDNDTYTVPLDCGLGHQDHGATILLHGLRTLPRQRLLQGSREVVVGPIPVSVTSEGSKFAVQFTELSVPSWSCGFVSRVVVSGVAFPGVLRVSDVEMPLARVSKGEYAVDSSSYHAFPLRMGGGSSRISLLLQSSSSLTQLCSPPSSPSCPIRATLHASVGHFANADPSKECEADADVPTAMEYTFPGHKGDGSILSSDSSLDYDTVPPSHAFLHDFPAVPEVYSFRFLASQKRRLLYTYTGRGMLTSMLVQLRSAATHEVLMDWDKVLISVNADLSPSNQIHKIPLGRFLGALPTSPTSGSGPWHSEKDRRRAVSKRKRKGGGNGGGKSGEEKTQATSPSAVTMGFDTFPSITRFHIRQDSLADQRGLHTTDAGDREQDVDGGAVLEFDQTMGYVLFPLPFFRHVCVWLEWADDGHTEDIDVLFMTRIREATLDDLASWQEHDTGFLWARWADQDGVVHDDQGSAHVLLDTDIARDGSYSFGEDSWGHVVSMSVSSCDENGHQALDPWLLRMVPDGLHSSPSMASPLSSFFPMPFHSGSDHAEQHPLVHASLSGHVQSTQQCTGAFRSFLTHPIPFNRRMFMFAHASPDSSPSSLSTVVWWYSRRVEELKYIAPLLAHRRVPPLSYRHPLPYMSTLSTRALWPKSLGSIGPLLYGAPLQRNEELRLKDGDEIPDDRKDGRPRQVYMLHRADEDARLSRVIVRNFRLGLPDGMEVKPQSNALWDIAALRFRRGDKFNYEFSWEALGRTSYIRAVGRVAAVLLQRLYLRNAAGGTDSARLWINGVDMGVWECEDNLPAWATAAAGEYVLSDCSMEIPFWAVYGTDAKPKPQHPSLIQHSQPVFPPSIVPSSSNLYARTFLPHASSVHNVDVRYKPNVQRSLRLLRMGRLNVTLEVTSDGWEDVMLAVSTLQMNGGFVHE